MEELHRRLHHGIMKVKLQGSRDFFEHLGGRLAGKQPDRESERSP
jgi:hypothetical protein